MDAERIYTSLGHLEAQNETQTETLKEIRSLLGKHDERIGSLETTRTRVRGMVAALAAGFGAFTALFVDTH